MEVTWRVLATLTLICCFTCSDAQQSVCTREAVADVVFLVDGSSSIGLDNFQEIRKFLIKLVQSFDVGPDQVRIGLIQYSDNAHAEFLLNTYQDKESVLHHINSMKYKTGGTNTGLGLQFMLTHLFTTQAGSRSEKGVPKLAMVITDGKSQDDVKQMADIVKGRGITLYAVGIKDAVLEELKDIASDPVEKHIFSVSDFYRLQFISDDIIRVLCTMVGEATGQLSQVPQECRRDSVGDIVLLVDSSSSVGSRNFREVKKFLRNFVEALDTAASKVQVGLTQYSDDPSIEFKQGELTDKKALLERLDNLQYLSGATNTGKALNEILSSHFSRPPTSRVPTVPQIVVVITGGNSDDAVNIPVMELRQQGVFIFAVGVGKVASIEQIANRPHSQFLKVVSSYDELHRVTNGLLQDVCISLEHQREALIPSFADIVVLVESTQQYFQQIRSVLVRLVNQLDIRPAAHQIALAQYGTDTKTEFQLNKFATKEEILRYVRNQFRMQRAVPAGASLAQALEFASTKLFTAEAGSRISDNDVQRFLVVITTGHSQDHRTEIINKAHALQNKGVRIIPIHLPNAEHDVLNDITTEQYVFQFEQPSLVPKVKTVLESLDLWETTLTAQLNATRSSDCRSARLADIVFIVESGRSKQSFKLIRNFIYQIVESLDTGIRNVRVGIVVFSNQPKGLVNLNTFEEESDILQYIRVLPYLEGNPNMGKALTFAKDNMFNTKSGSRKGVQQVAIVITDGKFQDNVVKEAAALQAAGVTVYAVGLQDAREMQLQQIASPPFNNYVFRMDSFAKLNMLQKELNKYLCYNIIETVYAAPRRKFYLKKDCVQTEEADIYFLIDQSGSINQTDFTEMKTFVKEIIKMFRIGPDHVRVGLVKYEANPTIEFNLAEHKDRKSLDEAVSRMTQAGGGTKTGEALSFMKPLFQSATQTRGGSVPRFLITVTDGESQDSVIRPAETLEEEGIVVYAVGVKNANTTELKDIARAEERMFFVNDFNALRPLKDKIVQEICSQEVCKQVVADILFLIDSSGSIGSEEYLQMKEFMLSMVDKSDIGPNKVHVGVLQFSSSQQEVFPLDKFYDKKQMREAINNMIQLGHGTLTGEALRYSKKYFVGQRPGVNKFLIVITDGEAQDLVAEPAKELREQGISIHSIGVRDASNDQLFEISGDWVRVHPIRNFDALKSIETTIRSRICRPKLECKTQVADVIFLVDCSRSISKTQFNSMLKFMQSLVNDTEVGPNRVRFGVITFSDTAKMNFNLKQYSTKTEVRTAIGNIGQTFGNTYTAAALEFSMGYFSKEHGGRQAEGVPQILMVITDGEATDGVLLPEKSKLVLQRGINIYGIGVRPANKTEIGIMAGDEKKVFYVDDFEGLLNITKKISETICNQTRPACKMKKSDLVILVDGSESIRPKENFYLITNFTSNLTKDFTIGFNMTRIGMAQFSEDPKKEFHLNEGTSEAKVLEGIKNVTQIKQGTKLGKALDFMHYFFATSNGSRIHEKVPQNLLLITDGASDDDVLGAAERLRRKNIRIFVVGIGSIEKSENETLQQIAGQSGWFFMSDFNALNEIKSAVFEEMCTPDSDPKSCTMDIAFGFDISVGTQRRFFSRQQKLQIYLPDIIRSMSLLGGLCCMTDTDTITANLAFRVVRRDGSVIEDYNFEPYNKDIVKKLMALESSENTYFNKQLLSSFGEKFRKQSGVGRVKVLIIFTDGFDDRVEDLEKESDSLKNAGINALLLVSLDGNSDTNQLRMVEFGRGFGYKDPLSIGMMNVASSLQQQIETVAARECCEVMCQCSGSEGPRGIRGPPGGKGVPGLDGHSGYPGDEGTMGERGPPGPDGTHGPPGCPGKRGEKGRTGFRGNRGGSGEDGLDGIQGEQGTTGTPGMKGEKGDPGRPGRKGIPGLSGEKGQPGLSGDPGELGSENTIKGSKGEKGHPGLPGDQGADGIPGDDGALGELGPDGRRGPIGFKGSRGKPGTNGVLGPPGNNGAQGAKGSEGPPGPIGIDGLPGPQGRPGPSGAKGRPGSQGMKGQKGQQGDISGKGEIGQSGIRGPPGEDGRDGNGWSGPKGQKGDQGFPGYPGVQGEEGNTGTKGHPGRKGNRGQRGKSGQSGEPGNSGDPGPPGHKGERGSRGKSESTGCGLVSYIRDKCACSNCRKECPSYPTDLVIALDTSEDVTDNDFERMNETVHTLLEGLSISESNCPRGARVAVVTYNSNAKYVIRFSDYHRSRTLMEAISNIPFTKSSNRRSIGEAMRFVAHNVFKRTRQATLTRKVAIFITKGQSAELPPIISAKLELSAQAIITAVIAFNRVPNVRRAFGDNSLNFMINLMREGRISNQLEMIKTCILCYDHCNPAEVCTALNILPVPQKVNMDLAVVMDSSQNVQADQYHGVQELLGSVLQQIDISTQPTRQDKVARVAIVQQGISDNIPTVGQIPVRVEFDLMEYQDVNAIKTHILQNMRQVGGRMAIGYAVEWTIENILLRATQQRKSKVVLVFVGGETSSWDRAKLETVALQAKCQGVVLVTVTMGHQFNCTQAEELASFPLAQHVVHLGQVKKGNLEYADRFLRAFFDILSRDLNRYPHRTFVDKCRNVPVLVAKAEEWEGVPVESVTIVDHHEKEEYTEETEVDNSQTETYEEIDVRPEILPERGDSILFLADPASCSLPADAGSCKTYAIRWYFDLTKNKCARFWYSGCGGNANRFDSQKKCEAACMKTHQ